MLTVLLQRCRRKMIITTKDAGRHEKRQRTEEDAQVASRKVRTTS